MEAAVFTLGPASGAGGAPPAPRWFGVALAAIEEVLRLGFVTPVPLSPPAIVGATQVRGHVLPVIDTALAVGQPPSSAMMGETCLRVSAGRSQALLCVGRVEQVLELEQQQAMDAAAPGGPLVARLASGRGLTVRLLDVEQLLAAVGQQIAETLTQLDHGPGEPEGR